MQSNQAATYLSKWQNYCQKNTENKIRHYPAISVKQLQPPFGCPNEGLSNYCPHPF